MNELEITVKVVKDTYGDYHHFQIIVDKDGVRHGASFPVLDGELFLSVFDQMWEHLAKEIKTVYGKQTKV